MRFLRRKSIQIASASSILCDIFCSVTGRVTYHIEDPALGRVHPPGRAPQPLTMPPHRFSTDIRKNSWLWSSRCPDVWPADTTVWTRADREEAKGGCQGPHGYSQLSCWVCGSACPLTAWLGCSCSLPSARLLEGALTEVLARW